MKSKTLRSYTSLTARNIKLYFKDKITFFMSLLTPLILLVLFVLFLKDVYVDSLESIIAPAGFTLLDESKNIFAPPFLLSSVISTSSVTIAFCSATLMVNDKIEKSTNDFSCSPVKYYIVKLAYLTSTFISTAIVMCIIFFVGLIYLAIVGWTMTFLNVFIAFVTMLALILFGSIIACSVFSLVRSQGGISAIATLISSLYGFVSGAYMPISQYPEGMGSILGFNPGLYGTVILKNAFLSDAITKIGKDNNLPNELVVEIEKAFDLKYQFFGLDVNLLNCVIIFVSITFSLLGIYVLVNYLLHRKDN